jgi:hypothetical protein
MRFPEPFERMWLFLCRQDARFTQLAIRWLTHHNGRAKTPIVAARGPIVSLTTYGRRLRTVHLTLESIATGSVLPSRIILWLDDSDVFRNVPRPLRRLEERGLEIKLSQNYGPHTKYYPFLESTDTFETPLVTADDDVLYPKTWLSGLVSSFNGELSAISCYRAYVMRIADRTIAPYRSWGPCRSVEPNFLHFAAGSYGCIYPPPFLKELQAAGAEFRQLCPKADDVWLHVNAIRAGVKVKQITKRSPTYPLLPETQDHGLYLSNIGLGQNDIQIRNTYKPADIALLLSHCRHDSGPAVLKRSSRVAELEHTPIESSE